MAPYGLPNKYSLKIGLIRIRHTAIDTNVNELLKNYLLTILNPSFIINFSVSMEVLLSYSFSDSGSSSSGDSIVDKVGNIVSEEVKFNAQNGEGYYREVTYDDGGFRQYDTESGELIGSSYESDQDKLPSME